MQKGISQEKFSEMCGISVDGLRNIEANRYTPKAKTINKICDTFKISPITLLTINEKSENNSSLIEVITKKLNFCTKDELDKINSMIDVIK